MQHFSIPKEITDVVATMHDANFEAYLVGGCIRDLVMQKNPKDWDITTNAKPEELVKLFEERGMKVVYENTFGTVAVIHEDEPLNSPIRTVEITPYRRETTYSDNRHPDSVTFSEKLEDDLCRRDFTMNALAYDLRARNDVSRGTSGIPGLVDLYDGMGDIQRKTIRTVGDANERFQEDALRIMRMVRFAAQLGFAVSHETLEASIKNKDLIKKISSERIRDEFIKIIASPNPIVGIGMMVQIGLMEHVIPELLEGIGCVQGGAHKYDVFEHLIQACQHAADKDFSFHVRLAALFHDIGKPRTRRPGVKKAYTFYGHEVVGARMAEKIMQRLKFSKADTDFVVKLVRNHMFFSDTEQITLSAVRRIIQKIRAGSPQEDFGGPKDPIWELMKIRECDRVGMNKTEAPYRLRKYFAMIEEALRDPISVSQLAIDGTYMMNDLSVKPGPRMGWMLHALLEEVLEDPTKNTIEALSTRVRELEQLPDAELRALGEKGKETKDQADEEEVQKLHVKHGVGKKPPTK